MFFHITFTSLQKYGDIIVCEFITTEGIIRIIFGYYRTVFCLLDYWLNFEMEHQRQIKKVLGVLMHLSEHRGRNLNSNNFEKSKFFQNKSEELKNILTNNWNDIYALINKFKDFQKSLDYDRKNI